MKADFVKQEKKLQDYIAKLRNKIKDPEKNQIIDVEAIIKLMKYMAENLEANEVFESVFIEYLDVIAALTRDSITTSISHFISLTEILCKLCDKIASNAVFVDEFTSGWLQYLATVSKEAKSAAYLELKHDLFKKLAYLLVNARCASSQLRIFDILFVYIVNAHEPKSKLVSIFKGLVKKQTLDAIESVEWNETEITYVERQHLIRNINRMETKHSVCELMTSISFNNESTIEFPENDGWIYFHKSLELIEFWIVHDSKPVLISIPTKALEAVEIVESGVSFMQTIRFILKKHKPLQETYFGKRIEIEDFNAKTIVVTLSAGIRRGQLELLFPNKCKIVIPKLCSESSGNEGETEVIELPTDQQDELTFSEPKSSPIKENAVVDLINISSISKPTQPSRKMEANPESIIELCDDRKLSSNKSIPEIATDFFYGKHRKSTKSAPAPTPKSRPRRAAAKNAQKGIQMALEDNVYDFEKGHQSVVAPLKKGKRIKKDDVIRSKYPELPPLPENENGNAPKTKRRLWSRDYEMDAADVTIVETESEKPKVDRSVSPALTTSSFASSIANDPSRQQKRIFRNLDKINKTVAKRPHQLSRVSCSYRSITKPKVDSPDSTTLTEMKKRKNMYENDVIDAIDMKDDNFDVNMNSTIIEKQSEGKEYPIHVVRKELKSIRESAKRALAELDINQLDHEG